MPEYSIIKLKHLTPLHIGTGKENHYDFSAINLHSDTLSSALAALRAQQGNAKDTQAFLDSFVLSSAFPFWDDNLFLPKLQGKINISVFGKEEKEYRKQLKKLRYIDSCLWNDLVAGKPIKVKDMQLQDEFLIKEGNNFAKPFMSQLNQRVSVPRMDGQDADPFFFNWTYFRSNAGLYCITDAQGKLFEEIKNLFEHLGETGIGTDKNIGGGKFKIETTTISLPDIHDANQTMLLSLYIPKKEELPHLHLTSARYELVLRGGYMSGTSEERFMHLRKRSVYMFNIGSLFPTTTTLVGKTVNLTPAWNDERMHPVYRSGRPFCLPVKINES
jgi:CRISPR type III-A-associated RAMP protein Csm4